MSNPHYQLQRPRTRGNLEDPQCELFGREAGAVKAILFVHMGLVTDSALEFIREAAKDPLFQRHKGKKLLNDLRRMVFEADNRICRFMGGDIDFYEEVKEEFYKTQADLLTRYRLLVENRIMSTSAEYATALAYGTIMNSYIQCCSTWADEVIFCFFGSIVRMGDRTLTIGTGLRNYYMKLTANQFRHFTKQFAYIYEVRKALHQEVDVKNLRQLMFECGCAILDTDRLKAIALKVQERYTPLTPVMP